MKHSIHNIVVLSENNLVYQSLLDNISNENIQIIHIQENGIEDFHKNHHKATVTIIDSINMQNTQSVTNYSKYIFSFDSNKIKHSLVFKKPIKLIDFLAEIKNSIENDKLFNILDGHIYDELRSIITFNSGASLKLTPKENIALKNLLLAEDFFISKDFLLQNIWKYMPNSETNTIELHMQKLQSKLPNNMLIKTQSKQDEREEGYKLSVKHFF